MLRTLLCTVAATIALAGPARAIDEAHRQKAAEMAQKAIDYLRSQQDAGTGAWAFNPGGPNLPAVDSLALTGMLMQPGLDATDPAIARGIDYVLGYQQADGGIYDRILASYNTSIAVSMLARADTAQARAAIGPATDFLRTLQYGEAALTEGPAAGETRRVDKSHPFYGGVGYGSHGRPDNSNLNFMLQALHDAGAGPEDPAIQRALVFLQRTQMHEQVNDMPYAAGSTQGGFIYATGPEEDQAGEGESKAGMIEELAPDGTNVSRLRAYGSMTYAGFKSYAYAQLPRDDARVRLAREWIQNNYTLEENPAMGNEGLYYYYLVFGRAMDAWGDETITVTTADGEQERDWANDLIDKLATLQNADGSFKSVDDRWMEDNPVLITSYALIALQHARGAGD
ncbi:MAG: prenyltransferase/squalene oxidase repeat-containing protein [Phycisphaerales bacterium JB039]